MKIILGDNQFFGVNHYDLSKGEKTSMKFSTSKKISHFIKESLTLGLDGFMINSNNKGYKLISDTNFDNNIEIHYSIPYPHKYASMINENGMLSLLFFVLKNTSIFKNTLNFFKFLFTRNLIHLVAFALEIEVPSKLKKGSYIYLQNVITDLLIGMNKAEYLFKFINCVEKMGYKPGLITLNPVKLNSIFTKNPNIKISNDLIVCFNINKNGFNVFPSLSSVENLISSNPNYKLMGMSIFSSGGSNILEAINYIKKINLDYVVFGSSKLANIKDNLDLLKK